MNYKMNVGIQKKNTKKTKQNSERRGVQKIMVNTRDTTRLERHE